MEWNSNRWVDNIIHNVTAGNDIIGANKINENTLLLFTNEIYYLYDYEIKYIWKRHTES